MILKGQKRKLEQADVEVSDPSCPMWESQRQFVFSVSLNKYQRGQELPEPSLRRSVLIANTLRQIGLEKCGAPPAGREDSSPSGSLCIFQAQEQESTPDSALMAGDAVGSLNRTPLTNSHSDGADGDAAAHDQDDDWGSMSTESDFSLSAAISSILTALDSTIDGNPQSSPRAPLRSLENLSERGSAWGKHHGEENAQATRAETAKPSCMNDITMEDLVQDVGSSLLERDGGGIGIRSSRGGFPANEEIICYLPPFAPSSFSLSLNSNLKCLPSLSSFSPLSSSPSTTSPESASFSGQNQARDAFELEHLLEILVES